MYLHGHGLFKIAVDVGIVEVERGGIIVGEYEGEDGVLHEVVVRPSGHFVEEDQVLEIGEQIVPPELRHIRQALGRNQLPALIVKHPHGSVALFAAAQHQEESLINIKN